MKAASDMPAGGRRGDRGSSALGGSTVFLDITNLFDKAPAFYNGATGYEGLTGNPTGRVVTAGVRFKM
jgi:outer membrane receptor protein involved in Fe transport